MGADEIEALPPQVRRCLELTAAPMSAQEVATAMNLSVKTVNTYLMDARRRLGVSSSRQAARLLIEHQEHRNKLPRKHIPVFDETASMPTVGSGARVEERGSMNFVPSAGPHGPNPMGSAVNGGLNAHLKTIAYILMISAAIVIVLTNYPRIIDMAKAVSDVVHHRTNLH